MNNTLLLIVAVPVLGSFILPAIGRFSERVRNIASLLFVSASFVGSAFLLPDVLRGDQTIFRFAMPMGLDFSLAADGLAVFMAMTSSLIGSIIVLYSFSYISHYDNRNEYYMMVVLFLGSMMGLVFSTNLIILYVFWELTAIASWRLIGFFRDKHCVIKADKAFLITVFGAVVMLLGFIMLYQDTGTFDLPAIKNALGAKHVSDIAVILILFGILSKSAMLPFHTWLPDAGVAPSPVTALLHAAVLVKIGVYVYARIFVVSLQIDQMWHILVPAIAAVSALVSAGAALIETDLKRIIAYSTISQIAFIFLGFGIGTRTAVGGAIIFILMHGLAKGGLFLCAGIVEQNTRTKDITKLGGLFRTMPVTAISFLGCAFSIMGIPPFGGFFSKYMVFAGTIEKGDVLIAIVFMIGAIMTILYLLRLFNKIFLGEAKAGYVREGSKTMVLSVASLAALSLILGILIYFPSQFAFSAVMGMAPFK